MEIGAVGGEAEIGAVGGEAAATATTKACNASVQTDPAVCPSCGYQENVVKPKQKPRPRSSSSSSESDHEQKGKAKGKGKKRGQTDKGKERRAKQPRVQDNPDIQIILDSSDEDDTREKRKRGTSQDDHARDEDQGSKRRKTSIFRTVTFLEENTPTQRSQAAVRMSRQPGSACPFTGCLKAQDPDATKRNQTKHFFK